MSSIFPSRLESFVKPKERMSVMWCWFGIVCSTVVLLGGICQTQLMVIALSNTKTEEIRDHIAICRAIQAELSAPNQEPGIDIMLFDDKARSNVEDTWRDLVNDKTLQTELKETFGVSFQELNAVVIPSWKLETPVYNKIVGITQDGWVEAGKAIGKPDVGGITLRNRSNLSQRTADGRPRVILNPAAFGNLRLTLFHELMHAMNVPGKYPSKVTFAQNDLTYLSQYRGYVRREGLDVWHEPKIWGLAVILPGVLLSLIIRRLKHVRRRLERATLTGAVDATPISDSTPASD